MTSALAARKSIIRGGEAGRVISVRTGEGDRAGLDEALWRDVDDLASILAQARTHRMRVEALRRTPRAVATTARLARSLPTVAVQLSARPSGQELRSWFPQGPLLPLHRAPVAVLAIPADGNCLSGGRRQALRTNSRRATEAGIACAVVSDAAERQRCLRHVTHGRGDSGHRLLSRRIRPGLATRFTVAYSADGDPVAFCETVIDDAVAGLGAALTNRSQPLSQHARYLLHGHTVSELAHVGVSYLVVGGSLLLTAPGTRYFQRRTGFRPVRLVPLTTA